MPEDKDHHAPYSEITVENNKLIYYTKLNGPGSTVAWDKQVLPMNNNFRSNRNDRTN